MSAARFHDFEDTMPTQPGRLYRINVEAGTVITDDEAEAMHEAASACTEVGAEPRGKHRTGPLAALFLRLRRWALG